MKKDASVNVRLTSELREKLQKLADADGRKLSNYIERLLSAHVESVGKGMEAEPGKKEKNTARR